MELAFNINGETYYVNEYSAGYCWTNGDDEGKPFPEAWQAQQDAFDHVNRAEQDERESRQQSAEDSKYGTYEQQKRASYRAEVECGL